MNPNEVKAQAGEIPEIKYECESFSSHQPDIRQFAINMKLLYVLDLDHTADVQLHSWGANLKESFEQVAMAMFAYMTEIDTVEIQEKHEIEAESDDLDGLLFRFLDELLFLFSAEPFIICKKLVITELDLVNFKIKCDCFGETFELKKHPQGTEVKAITYSAMQIVQKPEENRVDVFVIIDI